MPSQKKGKFAKYFLIKVFHIFGSVPQIWRLFLPATQLQIFTKPPRIDAISMKKGFPGCVDSTLGALLGRRKLYAEGGPNNVTMRSKKYTL